MNNRHGIRNAGMFAFGLATALAIWVGINIANLTANSAANVTSNATAETNTNPHMNVTGLCTPDSNTGYTVTLTNNGNAPVEISGFNVLFSDENGNELGSDNEPGNGNINGIETINMNDWIGSDNSLTWIVTVGIPNQTAECEVIHYTYE